MVITLASKARLSPIPIQEPGRQVNRPKCVQNDYLSLESRALRSSPFAESAFKRVKRIDTE